MRRAKQPPPPELASECSVIADLLELKRRDAVLDCPALGIGGPHWDQSIAAARGAGKIGVVFGTPDWVLLALTMRAMAEYLRLFPKARKPNSDPWVAEPQTEVRTYERGGEIEEQLSKIAGLTIKKAVATYRETVSTGDIDYQCFFCRKSLFTRPHTRRLKRGGETHKNLLRHAEKCAVRMLAGLMKPHAPLPKGRPGL